LAEIFSTPYNLKEFEASINGQLLLHHQAERLQ
jgi:hypothetical protein